MNANSPCNCGPSPAMSAEPDLLGTLDAVPSLEALDADLDAAMAEDAVAAWEFETALEESELDPEEALAFAALEEQPAPSLDAVVAILQQYPGLNVSFSY